MHYDAELDARGFNCPLPILRAKKKLSELASGPVLKIDATDPSVVKDFQMFARQTGHQRLGHTDASKALTFLLQKK